MRSLAQTTKRALSDVESLSPSYFALVMATGIISLALHLLGWPRLALALLGLNGVMWCALWLLTVIRLLRYPQRFFGDMADHLRGPGFFTTVAGTAVLGSQLVILLGNVRGAAVLWVISMVLWLLLTYSIFTAIIIKRVKPTLDQGISGAWLLAVVATQSLTVLSALLAAHSDAHWRLELNFFALSMWLWGGMLYIWMASLIFYRYTFFAFSPGDLQPPYWINMGAMAISTLAGSLLIVNSPDAPFLHSLLPFLKGFTVFYWATGTWWVPMLVVLGVWRYVVRRFPMTYNPLYWGAVFPLGMYAASTHEMSLALELDFLGFIPVTFLLLALLAWLAAFSGLLRQLFADFVYSP